MIDKMQQFSQWNRDEQAACVMLYNMSLGRQPKNEELPSVRQSAIKERKKTSRRYWPKPAWTQDDRLELFAMFDQGCRDWVGMAKKFNRSEGSIRAQFDKSYQEFKGE
jgi:hypothetical protein